MNLKEICKVLNTDGLANTFGDNAESQTVWLIDALNHALTLLAAAENHVAAITKEWSEIEAE